MRNEKKNKKDSRTQPRNADNNSRDKEKKTLKKQLDPPCKSQEIMVESSITIEEKTRVPRTPVAFRREGFKRVKKNMQTTNNNTLTKKGANTMKCFLDIFFAAVALLPAALLFIL
tara:strand:- start:581 stop:925 length:345 start_codon:yes stop_codon:yes gene_type:complete